MSKTKDAAKATPRPDIGLKDEDYIAKTKKPNLHLTRAERVIEGYQQGLPLESLMRSTGYSPKQIFALLGLNEVEDHQTFQKLSEVYEKRVKSW